MDSLSLFTSRSQRVLFLAFLSFIFALNLVFYYNQYTNFTKNEVVKLNATILNIYPKKNYNVIKLKSDDLVFFTSIDKTLLAKQLQTISIYLITKEITFLEYLKGFYAKSFNYQTIKTKNSLQLNLHNFIVNQHDNPHMQSLYSALFLATNITPKLREFTSDYSIAHLIAISGFHLGVLSAIFYFLINLLYKPIHQKYYPYRNIRYDISIVVAIILFGYLVLLDFVPSLLRAFVMLVFALLMLRSNIKLFSFETLFIIVIVILALFPKLLFSLSLWFSVTGVFYIFLFIHYFKNLNKYFQIVFFNFWIFLAMNPIIHYFFPVSSIEQFYSPFLTLLFTLFYPLMAVFHFIGYGDILDHLLLSWINIEINTWESVCSLEFFLIYIALSLGSIFSKRLFILLNIFLIGFTLYLFPFNNL
jgi:competence protein ComEC